MSEFDRRTFLGLSVGALSVLPPLGLAAAPAVPPSCVSSGVPAFLPTRLTVDCAARRNFQLFRKNAAYLGLTGLVNMSFVRGQKGSYEAGSLFLFPWLKPKGQTLARNWGAVIPVGSTQMAYAAPIPDATLPLDEYFLNFVLSAPTAMFIGFTVDIPYSAFEAKNAWFTNVDKLADGQGVGIDWTSHNLNRGWFGGSQWIPDADTCSGKAWRTVIVDGLQQASAGGAC